MQKHYLMMLKLKQKGQEPWQHAQIPLNTQGLGFVLTNMEGV